MEILKNHSDSPLVTVQLMMCEADVKFLPRAIKSIVAQDIPPIEREIQVLFDGEPTHEANLIIETHLKNVDGAVNFAACRHTGYYCWARNQGFPAAWGFYIATMDVDNEWKPNHLSGLLEAIRVPGEDGWPHFVYSRREYVKDEDCYDPKDKLPTGPSPEVPWEKEAIAEMVQGPHNNFVDTGDMLIPKSVLYELAERTGCAWNTEMRRFGDWDLVRRMAEAGFRGKLSNQVTNVYHWHGENLQVRRRLTDITHIPVSVYESLKRDGLIKG